MLRAALALVLTAASFGFASPVEARLPGLPAAAAPVHGLAVSGAGVGLYPAFDSSIERYAVTTTDATGGSVSVQASTSDPDGVIWLNGRRDADGAATVSGLAEGDEISVIVRDTGGTKVHSLVYLPARFPTLEVSAHQPGIAPGYVGLTLSQWNGASPNFETAVDSNGVPAFVRSSTVGSLDFKRQPNGNYSTARGGTDTPGRTGSQVVELDSSFAEVGRYETVGRVDTDGHDSVLLANGNRILLGYEPNPVTEKTDAVIQEVTATNDVEFEWTSEGLVDESTVAGPDYAHVNSVTVMADGDLLASFRHLSTVLKIATSDHDGFIEGDIVWKLGGRDSSFTFPDGDGGPCAQHTASELANGHILLFDNGSSPFTGNMCINPADPGGVPVERGYTRVTEYALDTESQTATPAWEWSPSTSTFGFFAGSAERLPNGNTMVGWAAVRASIATEVDSSGETVWELRDAAASQPGVPFYSTYRALKFAVPDSIDPLLQVSTPAAGATYEFGERVRVRLSCTDRGGSSLHQCGGARRSGDLLDTSTPGAHTVTLRAKDGAGNTVTVSRTYTVGESPAHPDAEIRRLPGGAWVGADLVGGASGQTVRQQIARTGRSVGTRLRVTNEGTAAADRFTLRGTAGGAAFRVSYFSSGRNITRAVTRGTFRTSRLGPGDRITLTVRVTRRAAARPGQTRTVLVRAVSGADPKRRDAVATVVRARR